MSEKKYSDPTNRVVCTFTRHPDAVAAKRALVDRGFAEDQVHTLSGADDAAEIDTSAKWFADTDKELKKFERELRAGNTVLSVPVLDEPSRADVHQILKNHDAQHITHFGEWITEVMR